ncbi:MAG: Maf family protein [Planctomycetia bacterium]
MIPGGRQPLLLASGSPRRVALLEAAGIAFERGAAPGVDETPEPGWSARTTAQRLAERKACAGLGAAPGRHVLGADTVVAVDGLLLGKPRDAADAEAMLGRLQGREHEVLTGVALATPGGLWSEVAVARVRMAPLSPSQVRDYVAGGEPMDKAGAYALQGEASAFTRVVLGEADTVVGLSVALVRRLLAAAEAPDGYAALRRPPCAPRPRP